MREKKREPSARRCTGRTREQENTDRDYIERFLQRDSAYRDIPTERFCNNKMSESVYTKLPVFDGSKEDWPFYKPKLKALLAKKKLSKILTWKGKLREDDFVWAQDYDKKKKKEEEEMQEMNVDAASILLQSIDTEKAEGKAAFYQVEQYMDDGFAGGHFPKAWKALCD